MASKIYPNETILQAFNLQEQGLDKAAIGRQLGIPRTTIVSWLQRPKPAVEGVTMAATTQQQYAVDAMQRASQAFTPLVEPTHSDVLDEFDAESTWQNWQRHNQKIIQRVTKQSHFKASLGNQPVAVSFVSDQHISRGPVDLESMRRDAELIASTPNMYAVLGGDGIDNHIKHRSGILLAGSIPDEQWQLYDFYLQILGESILVVIDGNHDKWTLQYAGLDMVNWITKEQKICYSPDEAYIDIKLGGESYTVAVRHQYNMNSRYNNTHAVKQWYRFGDVDFDIGCIGHHHEHAQESCFLHGKKRWLCRPGSYQILTGYSRQYGFGAVNPTSPTVVIFPDKRKMVGFDTCEDAAVFLRAVS